MVVLGSRAPIFRHLNSIQATNGAVMGTLRGAEALLCEDAIVDGNPDIVLALLRIVQMAYRSPAL